MYYLYGWPRLLRLPQESVQEIQQVASNRDKILTAVLTSDSVLIWYVKPCVPIISHRRSSESVQELGRNVSVEWRPDSAMVVVVTEFSHLIIYQLVVPTDVKTLYELIDPPTPSLRRENDDLFVKEIIPPLIFSLVFEVEVKGGISDLVAIKEELMVATKDGRILRYSWEGEEIRDYSLDLQRIPFCVDQQVLKAVPLADQGVFVRSIAYSPLIGGYAVVFNDGRAAVLFATTVRFDPNSVTGIWATRLEDANCVALNHKYKLIAFGRSNSQGVVYTVDEVTGGLVASHRLVLPTRDYPGCPGPVSCLHWTPDGTALAMGWARGGFSIWSTFGTMIMCSLNWDLGPNVTDPVRQNPLRVKSLDWSAEGYQLWIVNGEATRPGPAEDPGFPQGEGESEPTHRHLANRAMIIQFMKSPLSVNPSMSKLADVYLQGEDRLFLNLNAKQRNSESSSGADSALMSLLSSGNKHWATVIIPHGYIASSWPIRYTAMDDGSECIAVAGRTGFAHYAIASRKWRLFGNETQEKDFIVTGGLLWWNDFLVMGCYNLASLRDEIRMYPGSEKLDNKFAEIVSVEAQVLMLNLLGDQLISFSADNVISIFKLAATNGGRTTSMTRLQSFDTCIPGLSFHPACVVMVGLSTLKTGTHRSSTGLLRERSPSGGGPEPPSILLNIAGRVVMVQQQPGATELSLPTVLASGCETIWFPRSTNEEKPHLTASLWLYCGANGMRVWLPVFPREADHGHTFMSKRIMLHFPLEDFYPLTILFEDAIILGVDNDTTLYNASGVLTAALPYSTLQRTSLLFLHLILRQLIRRNLGYHAWEIARTCMTLPYFQHSLELLLHEVLEEEATSTEPIPDALLPSVVDFIQEFPVFLKTIGRCTRKTEVVLWQHLFSVVGSPRALFVECLDAMDLETAALYLLILQNLEPPLVAQNHATLLLSAALEQAEWDLAKDLVRFLRTIDIDEISLPPRPCNNQSPQVNPDAAEEEISLLLGTLQVPRGRRASLALSRSKHFLQRSYSETKPRAPSKMRHQSLSSPKDSADNAEGQLADEFYIDVILQRHARKLLTNCSLKELGTFAAQLDFDLVSWLKKECHRAARVDSPVPDLKQIHEDFAWPFPIVVINVLPPCDGRKHSNSSGMMSWALPKVDTDASSSHGRRREAISDSGYLSHINEDRPISKESEQTIHAMLRPLTFREDLSVLSEDPNYLTSPDERVDSPTSDWSSQQATPLNDDSEMLLPSRGHPMSEAQLRYLLQITVEATCLELASLISVVLNDSLALIRIVNVARCGTDDKALLSRIYQNLKVLEAWAQSECHGYMTFFQAIQPQLNSLRTYLLSQSNQNLLMSPVFSRAFPIMEKGSLATSSLDSARTSPDRCPGPLEPRQMASGSLQDIATSVQSRTAESNDESEEKRDNLPIATENPNKEVDCESPGQTDNNCLVS